MKHPQSPRPPKPQNVQKLLAISVTKEIERDGVGMGVLSDGTAYLTGSGLARMCGVDESIIRDIANNWSSEQLKPRGREISNLLSDRGFTGSSLFFPVEVNKSTHHAYPETVCAAFLEYYAFVAKPTREHALNNFRKLAQSSLRAFVYVQIGYDPTNRIPECWGKFHDRVSLTHHKVPAGYFSIFKEMADMIVYLIQAGLPVDESTVPDGSVGIHWGKYWTDGSLAAAHGERITYEHNYPDYFPQSRSNPQHPWAYPDAALPTFRKWMREIYLQFKLPAYLESQERKRALPPSISSLILSAVNTPQIANKPRHEIS